MAGLGRRAAGQLFALEDPTALEPAAREQLVEVVVDGLRLRGYVDRLDVSPAGDLRVVDYKTGTTPREAFEAKALFQMKFYALVLWRTRGVVPRQLRLMYLADTDTLSYAPDADELDRFERTLHGDLGGDRSAPRRPATSGPARAGCASGATTRPAARPSAARRRPTQAPRSGPGPRRSDIPQPRHELTHSRPRAMRHSPRRADAQPIPPSAT